MKDIPTWAMGVWVACVCAFTVAALVSDLRQRRIPNALTVTAFGLALAFHVCFSGWAGLKFAAGGFAVGFGVMFVLWLVGGGGGGDVKLMGAVGAWLGAVSTMMLFLGSVFVAVVMTAGILVGRWVAPNRFALSRVEAGSAQAAGMARRGGGRTLIPFAVPVCVAAWGVVVLKALTWSHHAG